MIQTIRKQARTLRLAIEDAYRVQITPASVLWPWAMRHVAWLAARYSVRANGKTSYSEIVDGTYRSEIMPMADTVLWLEPDDLKRKTLKGDTCRSKGVWLGRSEETDEHLLGTPGGVVKARSVRRMEPSKQHQPEVLLAMVGTPWTPEDGNLPKAQGA